MKVRAKLVAASILINALLASSCAKKVEGESDDANSANFGAIIKSEADLPECTPQYASQVYWVQAEDKFVVCDGTKFLEVKPSGEKGEKGEAGSTGPAGSPANSGVWLFDADGKAIGLLSNPAESLILMKNGGLIRVNFATGRVMNPVMIDVSGGDNDGGLGHYSLANCFYLQPNCAGECYLNSGAATHPTPGLPIYAPLKNAVAKSGASYYIASGSETLIPNLNWQSSQDPQGNSCTNAGPTDSGYAITRPYTLPEGITFPLLTPLSFGTKTQ